MSRVRSYVPDGRVLTDFFWDRSALSIIQGPIGCLSADTEVMTRFGWVRIDEWHGDQILAWDEASNLLSFERPSAYINEPCEEMWWFRNERSLSMMLSDEHRMPLYEGRSGGFRVRLASDVAAAPGRHYQPVSAFKSGAWFDEALVRLWVAVAADGCLPKNGDQVVVCVRKERKKQRMRELLTAARIPWKERQHSTRPDELAFAFRRGIPYANKKLALWTASSEVLEWVLDELRHWDGLHEGDHRWDGTCKETADFIQFAAHATGRRASISMKRDPRNADWAPIYTVNISRPGSQKGRVMLRGDTVQIERVPTPDGRKYCFTTSTGFFLARHNGRVFITGNSGSSSACCHKIMKISTEQLPDFDGERRTRWLIVRDTYPKLEKTTQRTWLDWFPEDLFGRFRASVPPTHSVRYRHPSGDGTWVNMEVIFHAIGTPEEAEEIAASFEITGFWVNEAQFVEKKVVDELLSRAGRYPSPARGPGATWYGGMLDLNAPLEGHWIPYMRGDVPLPTDWGEDRRMAYVKPDGWTFFTQPPGLLEEIVEGRPVYRENPAAENQKHLKQTYLQQTAGKDR